MTAFLAFGCYLVPEDAEETELELILPKSILTKGDKYYVRIELTQNGDPVLIKGQEVYEIKLKFNKENGEIKLKKIPAGSGYFIELDVGIYNPEWVSKAYGVSEDNFAVHKKKNTKVYILFETVAE